MPPRASPALLPTGWSRWVELLVVVGVWTLLGAIALVRRALVQNPPVSLRTIAVTIVEYGPWAVLTPAVFYLARRLPPERGHWAGRIALHLAVACLAALSVGVVQSIAVSALGPPATAERALRDVPPRPAPGGPPDGRRVAPPNNRPGGPPDGPRAQRGGPPLFQLSYQLITYLVVLGIGFARAFGLQLRERQAEALLLSAEKDRQAAQLAEARLRALRMQLNPHFLFNALNAVSALAEDDPAGVRRVVARLSALLRRVLESEAVHEIPLRAEVAFLRDYLDVQRFRFENRLEVEEDLSPETLDALIPTFILQPVVENAVEHGTSRTREPTGRLDANGVRVCVRRVPAVRANVE
jgi:hypothetical protein